jgi:hypothetical protein
MTAFSNFLKNKIQDLIWRGNGAALAGASITLSEAPTYHVGLIGGAAFPGRGMMGRSVAYKIGNYAWPETLNGRLYRCTTAGTTGIEEPDWPDIDGIEVTDGTAVWTEQTLALAAGEAPEPSGNGYERQPWECNMATVMGGNLEASSGPSGGASGTVSNLQQVAFAPAHLKAWGAVWGIAIFDAEEGGNLLMFAPSDIPKFIDAKDQIIFAVGKANTAYGDIQIILE